MKFAHPKHDFFVCPTTSNESMHLCDLGRGQSFEEWYQDVTIYKQDSSKTRAFLTNKETAVIDCDASWQDPYLIKNALCKFTPGSQWKKAYSDGLVTPFSVLVVVWLIAVIAVIGNLVVLINSLIFLKKKDDTLSAVQKVHHILLINLAAADFLVGIYLLCILIVAVKFPGPSGRLMVLHHWPLCDILGVMSTVASEVSVSVLILISFFRLYNIWWPYKLIKVKVSLWLVFFCWLFWFGVACIPLIDVDEIKLGFDYIAIGGCEKGQFPIVFNYKQATDLVETFLTAASLNCSAAEKRHFRLSSNFRGEAHLKIARHLKLVNAHSTQIKYYSQQNLCSAKYFPETRELSFIYSMSVLMYNFASFLFLFLAYVFLWRKSKVIGCSCLPCFDKPAPSNASGIRAKENRRLQQKTILIIASDFLCWVPMSLVSIWYVNKIQDLSNPDSCKFFIETKGFLATFATVVVPMNSAINPLLYSSSFVELLKKIPLWFVQVYTIVSVA